MSRITHACGSIGRSGKLLGSAAVAFLLVLSAGHAQTPGDPNGLHLVTLAPIPASPDNTTGGGMYSFDISYVDTSVANQTYYLADRSNKAVQVVDAVGNYVGRITANPPFAGFTGSNSTSGPNGVVAQFPWLFVTDANSRVATIDLRTNATVSNVSTGGAAGLRADELAYDPTHGTLLVVNNADTPPFATLISVNTTTGQLTVGSRLTFDTAHTGVDAQNGAEQPVWDNALNRFFLSIPQIGATVQNGAVIRINPFSATVDGIIPVNLCGPAGLTLGPNQNLFIGCNTVFDVNGNVWDPTGGAPAEPRDWVINATNGAIVAAVLGVGAGDEVWYNPGNNNYYATGSGSPERPLPAATASGSTPAGVVDANDNALSQRFPTYNVAAVTTATPGHPVHPAGTSHSIAANSNFNLVYVPIPANNALLSPDGTKSCLTGCVAVFSHSPD